MSPAEPRRVLLALAVSACAGGAPPLDTSCPERDGGPALGDLFHEMAARGIPGPPDTLRFHFGRDEVVVGWKNLLSGRALTLSCAYRREGDGWRLLRARLDEGTHALRVAGRAAPPRLVYRDADGRLLGVVAVPSSPDTLGTR